MPGLFCSVTNAAWPVVNTPTTFTFSGDWETELRLPALGGLQSRRAAYAFRDGAGLSDGTVRLVITDALDDEPDPTPAQLAAIELLLARQNDIRAALDAAVAGYLPRVVEDYELHDDPHYAGRDIRNVGELYGISEVHVHLTAREGVAYFDLAGGCDWDEDHGLCVLFHRERVVDVGIDDGSADWKATRDAGIEPFSASLPPPPPRRYAAHAKYGKLKPSQASANAHFEFNVVRGGHTDLLRELMNTDELDPNQPIGSPPRSLTSIAVAYENRPALNLLLESGATADGTVVAWAERSDAVDVSLLDLLVEHGADVDAPGPFGTTALHIVCEELVRAHDRRAQRLQYGWDPPANEGVQFSQLRAKATALVDRGASLYHRRVGGLDVFDFARRLKGEERLAYEGFLRKLTGAQELTSIGRRRTAASTSTASSWWRRLIHKLSRQR